MGSLASVVIMGVEELIKLSPNLIADFQQIFSKQEITPADWQALRAKVASKSYSDYVPQSDLPKA